MTPEQRKELEDKIQKWDELERAKKELRSIATSIKLATIPQENLPYPCIEMGSERKLVFYRTRYKSLLAEASIDIVASINAVIDTHIQKLTAEQEAL